MVKLDRITTGSGDTGTTSLADGTRVAKNSPRVCAFGTVDEVSCMLGLVRLEALPEGVEEEILRIQHDLYDLGADLATPPGGPAAAHIPRLGEDQVGRLEEAIASVAASLEPAESFILPGGSRAAALLHLARTVARRAEREVIGAMKADGRKEPRNGLPAINPLCLRYLNRLSDLCFVWARLCNDGGRGDVLWKPFHER
jgi:cob(I)alamin adenosyltransferase